MPVATPRPASTIVVMRESASNPFEVLMVRRHDNVAFMGGAYVFPGGRVDDEDVARAAREGDRLPGTASRFADLTPLQDFAHRLAGSRELLEEVGLTIPPHALEPFAHWVTPEVETRRYDARFFVTRMPDQQTPVHDAHETTEFAWYAPRAALDRCRAGAILLPPPTWTTLKALERFDSASRVLEWARTVRIFRIQPALLRSEDETLLTLPGDPTHPPIDGWDTPEHTRFALRDGRWLPVSN
jgi:8-oxo-dGTP pyrophosphatase MutT (NUDIX family)